MGAEKSGGVKEEKEEEAREMDVRRICKNMQIAKFHCLQLICKHIKCKKSETETRQADKHTDRAKMLRPNLLTFSSLPPPPPPLFFPFLHSFLCHAFSSYSNPFFARMFGRSTFFSVFKVLRKKKLNF